MESVEVVEVDSADEELEQVARAHQCQMLVERVDVASTFESKTNVRLEPRTELDAIVTALLVSVKVEHGVDLLFREDTGASYLYAGHEC